MVWHPSAMILGGMKWRDHIIKMIWEQDGARQEMILQLDKHDYDSILNALQSVIPVEVKKSFVPDRQPHPPKPVP